MLFSKRFIISIFCLSFWLIATASSTATPPVTSAPASTTIPSSTNAVKLLDDLPNIAFKEDYCPEVKTLKRSEDLWWTGPSDWKSDSESFVYEIGSFLGARWTGINVGKVVCLYGAKGKQTFPIAMVRETLVPEPKFPRKNTAWGVEKGGYKDCESHNVRDCPFFIEQKKKHDDVYKDLDFFKGKEYSE